MRTVHILGILVLLAVAAPAAPAHAGGVVTVCDEAHLLAALAGGGTVTFACSGTIILTAEITIAADTTIDGSGQTVAISGNNSVRVLRVNAGATLNLSELTVANGSAGIGGGINNSGMLTVSNSTFSDNSASDSGGGIGSYGTVTVSNSTFSGNGATYGGGIYSLSALTVSNSTFSGNSATAHGGGIDNSSTVTVTNSTFSGNGANISGGGIFNTGTLNVSNSTFSGNSATISGGGIRNEMGGTLIAGNITFFGNTADQGGGIFNGSLSTVTMSNSTFSGNSAGAGDGIHNCCSSPVTLKNSIVANSSTGGNCSGTITDGGGNLSFPDTTCPGINADPVLGRLQNNGGPTETMALGEGSAAIDTADDAICAAPPVNNLDQRGVIRPQGLHCDIGAVEQIQEPSAVSVSALRAQSLPGTIMPAMIAGLLLLVLVAVGVRRRQRHMIWHTPS